VSRGLFESTLAISAALFIVVISMVLGYGSQAESQLLAYPVPRYRWFLCALFAFIVLAAHLGTRLERIRQVDTPRFRRVAGRIRAAWARTALSSPLWLRLPLIIVVIGIFAFFVPPLESDKIIYRQAIAPAEMAGMPQLIADSRGAGTSGFSRIRVSDQVFYATGPGYMLCTIDSKTGHVIWQGSLNYDNMDDTRAYASALESFPDGTVGVAVRHGLSAELLTPDDQQALLALGATVSDKDLGKTGYILVSAKRHGRFVRIAEIRGDHCVLTIHPNIIMRIYYLFRRFLPEISVTVLLAIMVLLVAGFARANHGVSWPNALRYGVLAGPAIAIAILWFRAVGALVVLAAGLAMALGTYLIYRDAFLNRRKTAFKTMAIVLALISLTYPTFMAHNYGFTRLLALFLAAYLAWKAYSILFGKSEALTYPVSVFLATRIPLFIVAYFSRLYVHGHLKSPWDLAVHWDATYYLNIAASGYDLSHTEYSTANFFPLYPFFINVFRRMCSNNVVSGVIVSNVALIAALCLLYRFVQERWGQETARRAVLLISIAPASFFFSAIYTESLFLVLSLAFFIFILNRRWLLAGICGSLAAMTRSVGLLLLLVAGWEYLRNVRFEARRARRDVAWLLLIPAGAGLFSFILYAQTGDMFANLTASRAWGRYLANPLSIMGSLFSRLDLNFSNQDLSTLQLNLMNGLWLLVAALVLLAVFPIARQQGASFALFTAFGMLLPLSAGLVEGTLRFELVLFPVTILLALLSRRDTVYLFITAAFASLMTFFAILFVNDLWMV